jgi:hypothetical protein
MQNTLSLLLVGLFICCCKLRLVNVFGLSFISYAYATIHLHTIQFDVIPPYTYTTPNYTIPLKLSKNYQSTHISKNYCLKHKMGRQNREKQDTETDTGI